MTRRQLIRILLQSGVSLPFMNSMAVQTVLARDPVTLLGGTMPAVEDRKVILIRMFGGNDGLNTVIPYQDPLYYKLRHEQSAATCAIPQMQVLPLSNHMSLGLHPAMKGVHTLYEEGKVAIIQNVGYPNQDLSHFRSTDIWLTATDTDVFDKSGWMGRYLEARYSAYKNTFPPYPPAIEFGSSLGRLLLGRDRGMGFAFNGMTVAPDEVNEHSKSLRKSQIEQNYINKTRNNAHNFLKEIQKALSYEINNTTEYKSMNRISAELSTIAKLIAGGLKTPVYSIISDLFFDNHEYLLFHHNNSLNTVMGMVYDFHKDLEKLGVADNVITVLYSEFGRRVVPNGSGTDHGAAGNVIIIGNNIKGGVYGDDPDLLNLDESGNLKYQYDFRQIYAELISDWLGGNVAALYPQLFRLFPEKISFLPSSNTEIGTVHVFPNPCTDYLTISVGKETVKNIYVLSVQGTKVEVSSENFGDYGVILDTKGLVSGTYYMKIQTEHHEHDVPFVKIQ